MKLVVLEYLKQLEALKQEKIPLADCKILSINPLLSFRLRERKILFEEIYDEILTGEWDRINQWCREKSLTWYANSESGRLLSVDGFNIGDLLYYRSGRWIYWFTRNHETAKAILKKYAPKELIYFRNQREYAAWPLEKRDSIQYLLRRFCIAQNIPTREIVYKEDLKKKISFKEIIRSATSFLYSKVSQIQKGDILVYGRMDHLRGVLSSLIQRGLKVSYCDEKFNLSHYDYCKKKNVNYILLNFSQFETVQEFEEYRLKQTIRSALAAGFKDQNWEWASDNFAQWLSPFTKVCLKQLSVAKTLIQGVNPKLLLIDEDWQERKRAFVAVFKQYGVDVVAVSHGIPALNFRVNPNLPRVNIAEMLVNSEFEKEKYEIFGYDPASIHVTGLPRYDDLFNHNKVKSDSQGSSRSKKIVLYCPHAIDREVSRKLGINTTPEITIAHTKSLIQACAQEGVRLYIKLHYDRDEHWIWNALVREYGNEDTKIYNFRANVFRLLSECDLLVTTFSSVVVEALLLNKLVITLNFTGAPDVHPFAEEGVAVGVYRAEDLPAALHACLSNEEYRERLALALRQKKNYFCGLSDGQNTDRTVSYLETKILSGRTILR